MPITRTEEIIRTEMMIQKRIEAIGKIFLKHEVISNLSNLKLQFGPEVEFNTIAGEEFAHKRLKQILKDGVHAEGKRDNYMPKAAQHAALNKAFQRSHVKNGRRAFKPENAIRVDKEPDIRAQFGIENSLIRRADGTTLEKEPEMVAFSQKELVRPPSSPISVARWLDAVYYHLISQAEAYELKGVSLTTRPHIETTSSSIHMHMSLSANGQDLLSKKTFGGMGAEGDLSDLALCIGHASNHYIRDAFPIFAPSRSCYIRFSDQESLGPKTIRVGKRKERGSYPTAIFRGAGRICGRIEDETTKPDTGPLRLEIRVAGPEAAGHPNRKAYPDLAVMAYELVEAHVAIIEKGVKLWDKRQIAKRAGEPIEEFTEEKLFAERFDIPPSLDRGVDEFHSSLDMAEEYYGRRNAMVVRWNELSKIVELDRSPNVEVRGPMVDRGKEIESFVKKVGKQELSRYGQTGLGGI